MNDSSSKTIENPLNNSVSGLNKSTLVPKSTLIPNNTSLNKPSSTTLNNLNKHATTLNSKPINSLNKPTPVQKLIINKSTNSTNPLVNKSSLKSNVDTAKEEEKIIPSSFIDIRDLNFDYDKHSTTLKDVNIKIDKGSFHGLIGHNGAGKSTLIKLLIKSLIIQTGSIKINNKDIYDTKNNDILISYIPDESVFPSSLNCFDYLYNEVSILRDRKVNKKHLKRELEEYFNKFSLPMKVLKKSGNALSGGQKKKLELVRIMIEKPDILILDEPTNFLDPDARLLMFTVLKKINREFNTTILVSSHILDELKNYIDSCTIIKQGEVKYNGDLKNVDLIKLYKLFNKETEI